MHTWLEDERRGMPAWIKYFDETLDGLRVICFDELDIDYDMGNISAPVTYTQCSSDDVYDDMLISQFSSLRVIDDKMFAAG